MEWNVILHHEFDPEVLAMPAEVRVQMLSRAKLLAEVGPQLGRPTVDTLKGSKHQNMKEIRFNADGGVWRTAFAFDYSRQAVLLVAGDKANKNQSKFYEELIRIADKRFTQHLESQQGG